MSGGYHDGSRELQDRFDTRRLADRLEARTVRVQRVFPNCPRYIHRMELVERSPYVPRAGAAPPVPDWKRSDLARGALPAGDPAAEPPAT